MTVKLIRADDVPPVAWKNGGGVTRDLWCEPAGADWRWRISLADIDRDGPFSAFPGVERWFAVVEGAGVRLSFADHEQRIGPHDHPVRFDGADAPGCQLINGRTRDLNLMLRGGARGVMVRGEAWYGRDEWPLSGRFDIQTMSLHWGTAADTLRTPGPTLWIGVAP